MVNPQCAGLLLLAIVWIGGRIWLARQPHPADSRWQVFYTFTYRADGVPVPVYKAGERVGRGERPNFVSGMQIPWVLVSTQGYQTSEEAQAVAESVATQHRRELAIQCLEMEDPRSHRPLPRYIDPLF